MPKPKYKGLYKDNLQPKSDFGKGKKLHAYRKTFTKIIDGIKEIIDTVPKIRSRIFPEYLPDVNNDDATAIRQVFDLCKGVMDRDFPLISSDDYPNTYTLTIRGDSFFFRTKDGVSFSWEYDHRALFDGEISIVFSLIFNEPRNPLMYKSFKSVIEALTNKGWVKYDLDAPRDYRSKRANRQPSNNPKQTNPEPASMYQLGNTANIIVGGVPGTYGDLRDYYNNNNKEEFNLNAYTISHDNVIPIDSKLENVPKLMIESDPASIASLAAETFTSAYVSADTLSVVLSDRSSISTNPSEFAITESGENQAITDETPIVSDETPGTTIVNATKTVDEETTSDVNLENETEAI